MPTDPPWESRQRLNRWAHCEAMPSGNRFMLRVVDEEIGETLTAEITLSEAMALRAFIGNAARQFTSQARFRSGT